MPAPVLPEILRQHVEMAAFLWTLYDHHLLHPDENPDMDEVRIARLIERIEAHLDGIRVAGGAGLEMAKRCYSENLEPGELFVLRMITTGSGVRIRDLDVAKVRAFIAANLPREGAPS